MFEGGNMKVLITDRTLRALKPAPVGKRTVIWDTAVPSLCVRVTDKGNASFSIMRRLHGKLIRRIIGLAWHVPFPSKEELPYPLSAARNDARADLLDICRGIDPKVKREAEREAAERAARETFAVAAKDFLAGHVAKLRSARDIEATFRKYLLPEFGKKPVANITDDDIVRLLKAVAKKSGPYMARNLCAYLSKFFRWAIAQRCYGVRFSPCTEISRKDLLGSPSHRTRVLRDSELLALWKAAEAIGYPGGQFIKVLILTGVRRTEAAAVAWPEIDLEKKIWVIPASRMKSGKAHVVPLSPTAIAVLESIPRWPGPYVFSSLGGKRPISGFGALKKKIDTHLRGVDPWTIHDIRRSVRTGLSALRIPDMISELVIGHAQKGLHRVYDQHSYLSEKRDALETWARHVMAIVELGGPDNVVKLKTA
jgi:integrase